MKWNIEGNVTPWRCTFVKRRFKGNVSFFLNLNYSRVSLTIQGCYSESCQTVHWTAIDPDCWRYSWSNRGRPVRKGGGRSSGGRPWPSCHRRRMRSCQCRGHYSCHLKSLKGFEIKSPCDEDFHFGILHMNEKIVNWWLKPLQWGARWCTHMSFHPAARRRCTW